MLTNWCPLGVGQSWGGPSFPVLSHFSSATTGLGLGAPCFAILLPMNAEHSKAPGRAAPHRISHCSEQSLLSSL